MQPTGVSAAKAIQPKLRKRQQVESERTKASQWLQANLSATMPVIQRKFTVNGQDPGPFTAWQHQIPPHLHVVTTDMAESGDFGNFDNWQDVIKEAAQLSQYYAMPEKYKKLFNEDKFEEAIENLFRDYGIGDLNAMEIKVDRGPERFHAKTEKGFDPKGQYQKPEVTVSKGYIERMLQQNSFERIIRTLRHEWEHVKQRNNQSYRATSPSEDEMEFLAYYAEIFDLTLAPHQPEQQKKKLIKALEHVEAIPEANRTQDVKDKHKEVYEYYKEHFKKRKRV